jgi:hypothetical protein
MVSITKVTNCASGIDAVADQNSKAISNSVSVKSDMQIITHNSVPVVTTEMLAELYGSGAKLIRQNHQRNEDRFVAGKHYFKLSGDNLKQFKNEASKRGFVKIAPTVNHLLLWTEQGAARHAKMLETDKAWEVFEQLEECYFNKKAAPIAPALPSNYIEALERLVIAEKEKVSISMERDHAINTKAEIGSRREATSMAKASAETRRANKLAKQLGECIEFATVKAVENKTKKEHPFFPLRKYCKEHGLSPNDVPDKTYGTVKAWPAQAWLSVYNIDIKAMFGAKPAGEDAA